MSTAISSSQSTTFRFVVNADADRNRNRKLIRSHVMLGKNVGKTMRNRKPSNDPSESRGSDACGVVQPWPSQAVISNPETTIQRPLGDELACFTFPCKTELSERRLIHHAMYYQLQVLYPKEFCLEHGPMRAQWFEYIQRSEAFFHCSLVLATITIDALLGKPMRSVQALKYLANTYSCVNQDLQQHSTPSESTYAVIVSLAVHGNLTDNLGVSRVHLEALKVMLDLRGGIEAFSSNWMLWHKICRVDIDRTLHEGCDTVFYRHDLPARALSSTLLLPQSAKLDEYLNGPVATSLQLQRIMEDINLFCRLLNQNPLRFGMQPAAFQNTLIIFAYRSIQFCPLAGEPPENGLDYALHTALLGFVTTILFEYGRMHVHAYDLLANRLRTAISGLTTSITLEQQSALLWVLFVGGISVCGRDDEGWLFPSIRSCLSSLDVKTWDSTRAIIEQLPWIRVAHDMQGRKLWQAVTAAGDHDKLCP